MRAPLAVLIALFTAPVLWSQPAQAEVQAELWARIEKYVSDYFGHARTIVARENVRLQPVDRLLRPEGQGRILSYELRIDWIPSENGGPIVPSFSRRLVKSMGHLGLTPSGKECFDPTEASVEPLTILLPEHRSEFTFVKVDARDARPPVVAIDYAPVEKEPPKVIWDDPCGRISLDGAVRGRFFVDATTGTVLRVDERLDKPFQFALPLNAQTGLQPQSQTIDRLEVSIRYAPVKFRNPDETLMLPKSARTISLIHNGVSMLKLQTFDEYRRFITGGRVVQ